MATQSPPFALQNGAHSAALFRQAAFSAFTGGGTLGSAELVVAAQSTPNMSVQVSAGRAWIPGTQVANASGQTWSTQAAYFGLNDAPLSATISAANATNPRIDIIYVSVNDAFYSGSLNTLVIGVATGTPAATPVAPAIPSNAFALANVAVAANATSIVSGNIASARPRAVVGGGAPLVTSLTPNTGWTASNGFGGWVDGSGVKHLTGWLSNNATFTPAGGELLCTLPAALWPTGTRFISLPVSIGQTTIQVNISSSTGAVTVARPASAISAGAFWEFAVCNYL